ncbi:MAG: hypothetical protein K0U15_04340 [Proteobacteria bacterium]|nr:hypothetical protein [Pseudomonadota bacterium]MCH9758204.1 hypothetical protein [Pseudomonadota bacterium]
MCHNLAIALHVYKIIVGNSQVLGGVKKWKNGDIIFFGKILYFVVGGQQKKI